MGLGIFDKDGNELTIDKIATDPGEGKVWSLLNNKKEPIHLTGFESPEHELLFYKNAWLIAKNTQSYLRDLIDQKKESTNKFINKLTTDYENKIKELEEKLK